MFGEEHLVIVLFHVLVTEECDLDGVSVFLKFWLTKVEHDLQTDFLLPFIKHEMLYFWGLKSTKKMSVFTNFSMTKQLKWLLFSLLSI